MDLGRVELPSVLGRRYLPCGLTPPNGKGVALPQKTSPPSLTKSVDCAPCEIPHSNHNADGENETPKMTEQNLKELIRLSVQAVNQRGKSGACKHRIGFWLIINCALYSFLNSIARIEKIITAKTV